MTGSASRRAGANPYVGPRPFEPGETLYGREDEIGELYYLWKAERIVLLHSPSGAGKSSLLQAGLLPRIQTTFDVWGPTRVNLEPSAAGGPSNSANSTNRYALSAMQGFEEGVPEHLRRPTDELAGLRLSEYVEKRPRQRKKASMNVALLFDQFEEILTVDPLATEEKHAFFDQLGELLRNPRIWALFVLREDFLAPLDPYTRQVPTHLKNRFRIDLLSLDSAREAMVQPALAGGRAFPAADQLLHDLATMKVQQTDGSFVEETGLHVEPVQLQVVCFRLWDAMPVDDLSIDPEDLERFGDVTEALSGYYADSVQRLADGDKDRERSIRDWFGERLITAGGTRGQVLRGADESEGLTNETIAKLLDTHLVRAEQRAGATWYELAHDRLIEPVSNDNAAWRTEHLSEVQHQAALWERQGRPPGLLLRDAALVEGERWAADAAVVAPVETRFLQESRKAQDIAERERRQQLRIKRLGLAAMVIGALALVASVFAVQKMNEANEQRQLAERNALDALQQSQRAEEQANVAKQKSEEALANEAAARAARDEAEIQSLSAKEQKQIAEANARKAAEQEAAALAARDQAQTAQWAAEQSQIETAAEKLRADEKARESARLRQIAVAEALAVRTTSLTEPGQEEVRALLALEAYRLNLDAKGDAEKPDIYSALRLALNRLSANGRVRPAPAEVRSLTVSPDGRSLAFGNDNSNVYLLDLRDFVGDPRSTVQVSAGARALAWSPGGRWIAVGSLDGAVQLLDGKSPKSSVHVLATTGAAINSLAFSPSSSRLAAGNAAGQVQLWDVDESGATTQSLQLDAAGDVRDVAWNAGGSMLAAAVTGRGILLWREPLGETEPQLVSAETGIRSVAFSRSGHLAAGTVSGVILVWKSATATAEPVRLLGHLARVEVVAFHPSLDLLASASADSTLRLWHLDHPDKPLVLNGHESWVWALAFSADGQHLFSGSSDRTVQRWTASTDVLAEEICALVHRSLTPAEWEQYLPAGIDQQDACSGLPTTPQGSRR